MASVISGSANRATVPFGTGTATPSVGGILTVSTTSAGTAADLVETDLWTYTLPANSLSANNKGVRIKVMGSTAANGNTKTVKLYFGGSVIATRAGADNGINWSADAIVLRTGAAAEMYQSQYWVGSAVGTHSNSTLAVDTTAAIIIKVTGQNGTANANDVVFKGAIVEAIP